MHMRFRSLARVVAIMLLMWTAADLADTSLCALDGRLTAPTQQLAVGAMSADGVMPVADDCFCCSSTVKVQSAFLIVLAAVTTPFDSRPSIGHLGAVPRPLYRPPQPVQL